MNTLKIVEIKDRSPSKDDRNYKTAYFQENLDGQVLSNRKPSGRNVWEEGPNGSAGDTIYSDIQEGSVVAGSIQTIEVEDFFIPSEYGKFRDENGEPANKVNTYSSVVFEGENITTLARSAGHTLAGQEDFDALEESQEIDQELAEA